MEDWHAYGSFIKQGENYFRTSAYIQWGDSQEILGSIIMCNPGSAFLENVSREDRIRLENGERVTSEIKDPTVTRVAEIVKKMDIKTGGILKIYNLFTLRNANMDDATKTFGSLNDDELLFKDYSYFRREYDLFPWVIIAWGCQKGKKIVEQKNRWLNLIREHRINIFGKQGKSLPHFWHPLLKTSENNKLYEETIVNQYATWLKNNIKDKSELKKGLQKFTTYAVKPNLIVKNDQSMINEQKYNSYYGWNIMNYNPQCIVRKYSHIWVKNEYKLITYQHTGTVGASGLTYAIPKDEAIVPPKECEKKWDNNWIISLKPPNALSSFMEAITGDKSALSYLQAAIVYHELRELGAEWHGTNWGRDLILPLNDYQQQLINKNEACKYTWKMCKEEPEIWEPHFYYNENEQPVVIFYTVNDIATVTLNMYKHVFEKGSYSLTVEHEIIAEAGDGIIF